MKHLPYLFDTAHLSGGCFRYLAGELGHNSAVRGRRHAAGTSSAACQLENNAPASSSTLTQEFCCRRFPRIAVVRSWLQETQPCRRPRRRRLTKIRAWRMFSKMFFFFFQQLNDTFVKAALGPGAGKVLF